MYVNTLIVKVDKNLLLIKINPKRYASLVQYDLFVYMYVLVCNTHFRKIDFLIVNVPLAYRLAGLPDGIF
jgi:hypothetical protein